MQFDQLYHTLKHANHPEELFGDLSKINALQLKQRYRNMAHAVHPDHHPTNRKAANDAFKLLQCWYQSAVSQLTTPANTFRITSAKATYRTHSLYRRGDLADLYQADDGKTTVLLKIGRLQKNNDLMHAEADALRRIERALAADPLRAHFPTLRDSFKMRDEAGVERSVNVLQSESAYVTLADILTAYPDGIDAADAAWMFNRILGALAKAHDVGLVHGAVLPEHVLLRLSDHNGMLIDWCYSIAPGSVLKAISPPYRAFYPPEVFAKRPATAATDIYMAAVTLLCVLGGDVISKEFPERVPKPISALLRSCLLDAPHRRPSDAWALFDDFHAILRRLYGRPRFRPFSL